MVEYVLNCEGYTRECFDLMANLLELVNGVNVTDVEPYNHTIVLEFDNLEVENTVRKLIQMGDFGEIYLP